MYSRQPFLNTKCVKYVATSESCRNKHVTFKLLMPLGNNNLRCRRDTDILSSFWSILCPWYAIQPFAADWTAEHHTYHLS